LSFVPFGDKYVIIASLEKDMQYTIVIRKAPDGFYLASCPVIPEAHAQGESYEECLANIKEVLELCIEYRKERNEELPDEVGMNRVTLAI
jgi:predicted RNase H-like HicB family nuclease